MKRYLPFPCTVKKNYPFRKEKSDWDIALPDQTDDATYLKILTDSLDDLYQNVQPDFVFYLCGVDVIAQDKLGRLGLSVLGCKQRDEMVLQWCRRTPCLYNAAWVVGMCLRFLF
ncbi:MAG: hypothetical protein CM15mP83_2860 [Flavobacteriaceae bacterium]|nr:MAG: hypothetical protein CM15mP83_2860 [Flavobacteriaceae bacterium]